MRFETVAVRKPDIEFRAVKLSIRDVFNEQLKEDVLMIEAVGRKIGDTVESQGYGQALPRNAIPVRIDFSRPYGYIDSRSDRGSVAVQLRR